MKSNKGLIIAVVAGVAVAGLLGFMFGTEKGKTLRKGLAKNKEKIFNQAADVFASAKDKFSDVKDEMVKEGKKTQKFAEQFNDM